MVLIWKYWCDTNYERKKYIFEIKTNELIYTALLLSVCHSRIFGNANLSENKAAMSFTELSVMIDTQEASVIK